jgi:GMP synthase-like glutamine amidotransferase
MSRALILTHLDENGPSLVGEALEARGYELDIVLMNEQAPTPTVEGYDILVVLGSRNSVYDNDVEVAWFNRELGVIAEAERCDVPVLGICFGAQALCRYHGGVVEPSPNPEIGWYEIEARNNSGIAAGPWFEYHFDHCILPPEAELLATSPLAVQAFAVGKNLGVQFHPEVDDKQLVDWFSIGLDEVTRDFGVDPAELIEQTSRETPAARERTAALIDVFLQRAGRQEGCNDASLLKTP